MKDVIINSKTYEGVSRISVNTTEGTAYFKDEDEISGSVEVKTGTLELASNVTSGTFTFQHGCSKAPDIISIESNFTEVFKDGVTPSGTTLVLEMYDKNVGGKMFGTVSTTSYELPVVNAATANVTNDGHIVSVDDESITIKVTSNRRLDSRLTYTFKCIVM